MPHARTCTLKWSISKINALSFMDGFLMARTMLGDTRGKALENWDTRLGELFEGLQDDYAQRKLNFTEAIVYTEDFVKTMPELESWFTGLVQRSINTNSFIVASECPTSNLG
ncbi:hypothetical protein [Deinococcus arenicola]|uniref:Uncharacterized protein n=1 Tax=Deinococcus arenicola TaxID=2994950 RepID=A0ABU4DRU2_9DEIO|nr:hypothetical protein [Deinococcus sp. ZS9-10]MDV6374404.1 hypothetical protein [Deinococcus sp. ZS9-10]